MSENHFSEEEGIAFEDWVAAKEKELFRVDHFTELGKEKDYVFQSLVFLGNASQHISLANTILENLDEVPEEVKSRLKMVSRTLHDIKESIRKCQ